ncbi:MAG TPA: energy transducer TonB [Cyclobacteriaceae bacterium]|jgi:TonB family protein
MKLMLFAGALLLISGTVYGQLKVNDTLVIAPPVVMTVDSNPEFPGGEEKLLEFMNEKLRYPKAAMKKGIEGTVYVSFVVESDGSILKENIEIEESVHPLLDAEVIRFVKEMPNWTPAKINGRAVRCRTSLPVMFTMSE